MAAHDYSEFPEKKGLANKATPPPTHAVGSGKKMSFVEKPGPFMAKLPSTQPRPRGKLPVIKTVAMQAGLNDGAGYSRK